jgi:shikimate dehydrogenase
VSRHATTFTGILGWPLETTLSPAIHNSAFRALGLDWIYLEFAVPPPSLGAAIEGLRALGCGGANVTMPHKESVIEHLDQLAQDARAVGAVNTIQPFGERLIGHNTDVAGFRGSLVGDAGFDPTGRKALVLGGGGAARAVLRVLDDDGADVIGLAGRDPVRTEALMELARRASVSLVPWPSAELSDFAASADLVVNATPLGMQGEEVLPDVALRPEQCVVDLVYSPPTTPLLERARRAGADAWGGLGMLVHQAAESFRIWTGQDPPEEVMSAAAVRSLRAAPRPS